MSKKNRDGKFQVERARIIKRTLGTFTAARYLFLRGWSLEGAMWVLTAR
jgi:hypothetical protein